MNNDNNSNNNNTDKMLVQELMKVSRFIEDWKRGKSKCQEPLFSNGVVENPILMSYIDSIKELVSDE